MKKSLIVISVLLSFGIYQRALAQKNTPDLNKQIHKYVKSVIGKKVDRGECWDLANQALILINADWDKRYIYGTAIDPSNEEVFPGDLIQFENIKIRYTEENTTYTELMMHHTAVVYKVLGNGIFEIAHQNTEFSGKRVGISALNLNYIISGDIYFYRPTKKLSSNKL
ncbi:MAG: hypothetical protein JEY96_16405 [Bacteroidales bacterium]|nr:hypothetical protein [Bacteroidales bacterium]